MVFEIGTRISDIYNNRHFVNVLCRVCCRKSLHERIGRFQSLIQSGIQAELILDFAAHDSGVKLNNLISRGNALFFVGAQALGNISGNRRFL